MGTPITVLNTYSLGTCGKPPIPATTTLNSTVKCGGIPVVVVGSYWGFHCSGDDCHTETAVRGSSTVMIENRQVMNKGSSLLHGDTSGIGNSTVLIG